MSWITILVLLLIGPWVLNAYFKAKREMVYQAFKRAEKERELGMNFESFESYENFQEYKNDPLYLLSSSLEES